MLVRVDDQGCMAELIGVVVCDRGGEDGGDF